MLDNKIQDCCGCSACEQICPKNAITLTENRQGFLYPQTDINACTNCGLCERACPSKNFGVSKEPQMVLSVNNNNLEDRKQSSSGGVFVAVAKEILQKDGIVFGARFDDKWNVKHDYASTIDELEPFIGAKYVQSTLGDTFSKVRHFLVDNKLVLFTGTPCQVRGLLNYLRKDFANLVTMDFVCHGVPSPRLWQDYLKHINVDEEIITSISFRSKKRGWSHNSIFIAAGTKVLFDDYAINSDYFRGFISNIYLRESCFDCKLKSLKSGSDITIGDLWGVKDDNCDDIGTSLVLVNTEKGKKYLPSQNLSIIQHKFNEVVARNICITNSTKKPALYTTFWDNYIEQGFIATISVLSKMKPSLLKIILNKIFKIFSIR